MSIDYRAFLILVVDDERDILRNFELACGDEFTILTADGGAAGLRVLEQKNVAVIVADQRMPEMSGVQFLERSMSIRPDAVRIILTGYVDNEALVRAVNRTRIFRYVSKPWDHDDLRDTLRSGIEFFHLTRENARLLAELSAANERLAAENAYLRSRAAPPPEIVGESAAIREVLRLVDVVASSDARVLIEGESGTGKELVAQAIHRNSPRRHRQFYALNCAALSEGVIESELFGHCRGSSTGALADHKGLLLAAHESTLLLDEISEMPLAPQAKLLRVLQEEEIRPVGDVRSYPVDVRVIATTTRSLEAEVKAGRCREDLYYRLNVFTIRVPPLRERRDDIPLLARHLLKRAWRQLKKPTGDFTASAIALLCSYSFPGNVRELENEIERAVLFAPRGGPITPDLLSDRVRAAGGYEASSVESAAGRVEAAAAAGALQDHRAVFERAQIREAVERNGGNKARAAAELGLTYRGLTKKMQRLGMLPPRSKPESSSVHEDAPPS